MKVKEGAGVEEQYRPETIRGVSFSSPSLNLRLENIRFLPSIVMTLLFTRYFAESARCTPGLDTDWERYRYSVIFIHLYGWIRSYLGSNYSCLGGPTTTSSYTTIDYSTPEPVLAVDDQLSYEWFQKMKPPEFQYGMSEMVYEFLTLCHEILEAVDQLILRVLDMLIFSLEVLLESCGGHI